MAIRLTGTDTNGVVANANDDWWITLQGELVANVGVAFNFGDYQNARYTVQGTVISTSSHAVFSLHDFDGYANNSVLIAATGVVQGDNSGVYLYGTNNAIRNEGSVSTAGSDALRISGDRAEIINIGDILANGSAMQVEGDNAVIINHGLAIGGNALYLAGDIGRFENYGTMQGTGANGLLIEGDNNVIFNAGTITARDSAIKFQNYIDEVTTITNVGTLQSLSKNVATIYGAYGVERVENEGLIIGDIDLSGGNDRYQSLAGQLTGTLDMGFGDDMVILGDGALDTMQDVIGGDDSDTVDLSNFSHAIWADLAHHGTEVWTRDGNDLAPATGDWRRIVDLDGVENITGTVGIDLMRGNASDNTFTYVGNFLITGTETIDGRGGVDMVDFSRADFAVWVNLDAGAGTEAYTQDDDNATDAATGSSPWRRIADLTGIENLTGTDRVDQMAGTDGDNLFAYRGTKAFAGTEIIMGRGGSDTLDMSHFASAVWVDLGVATEEVWTQDDTDATDGGGNWRILADVSDIENIIGTDQHDLIRGDAGANVIDGGAGDDVLRGRGGADTFVFTGNTFGNDTIEDFSADNGEKIDLSGVSEITDFADLLNSHLGLDGGHLTIGIGFDHRIHLIGWGLADVGVGQALSADDFIF